MQSVARSCGRIAWKLQAQGASLAASTFPAATVQASAISCASCARSWAAESLPASSAAHLDLPSLGRYFSTSTPHNQNLLSQEVRDSWSQLTQHQKKSALKPDKNRNHFKRMWRKDLQIKQAHQVRRRQQAAVNATHQKQMHDKWQKGAALWRGDAEQQTAVEQT